MAQKRKSGCLVAVIVIVVAFVVVVGGILFVLVAKSSDSPDKPTLHREDAPKVLVFREDALPTLPFPIAGEELSREQFVSFSIDENATQLAKEEFRRIANQAKVRWELRTSNISENGGQLQGQFELPWEIRYENGSSSSAIQVRCEFLPESRSRLLNLRRGDWITIEGQLAFDGNHPTIQNARIANNK